ncbi:MAG: enoyl-CoA hydratase/isomerase family protein [Chitinophagaceae bacterium]|nr:MAG: enoyl-CoA hydratase/isomerase family protein [Chitinophagaceae bacterium]
MENNIGHVKTESHHGVTHIEFFHPQSNSMPLRLLNELASAIHGAGIDTDTKVILLKSAGDKAFCAGASFTELAAIHTAEEGTHFFSGFAQVINAMRHCPKLIIGRIHGKCVGGGVGLAAAVDYAIAHESAEIKLSELTVGIGPFVVGPAVERKIGLSAFTQLAIDAGMWRNTEWARRKGLFAEVHPTIEGMDESIGRLTNSLLHSSPQAMAEIKKISWAGTAGWDELLEQRAAISGKLVVTEHARSAIAAFNK